MTAPARRSHDFYMDEALRLARRYGVLPYPNPWVGCVVVRRGRIVGRGSHRGQGSDHAEIEALREAGARALGGALYVTLEPCCHYGRTPPCTDAILKAGVREVYYALTDPNPLVAGRSARLLRARGLVVQRGCLGREAAVLNEVYLKYRGAGLPFVTAKAAASLDGKIATRAGESKWITDFAARRRARELRAEHQAVLVGIKTVLADDPGLGTRKPGATEPWRIVLDSRLRIPLGSKVVQSGKCIVACTVKASERKRNHLERRGVRVWTYRGRRVPLEPLLEMLAENGIISVLVEGGGEVLGSFFDEGLIDRVCWFVAPLVLGSAQSKPAVLGNGVARLADAWRLRRPRLESIGGGWMVGGSLSPYALDDFDSNLPA